MEVRVVCAWLELNGHRRASGLPASSIICASREAEEALWDSPSYGFRASRYYHASLVG